MGIRNEWVSRAAFAEVAESLGVSTDQVMSVLSDTDTMSAVWNEGNDMFVAVLRRDDDAVLQVGERQQLASLDEFLEKIHEFSLRLIEQPGE